MKKGLNIVKVKLGDAFAGFLRKPWFQPGFVIGNRPVEFRWLPLAISVSHRGIITHHRMNTVVAKRIQQAIPGVLPAISRGTRVERRYDSHLTEIRHKAEFLKRLSDPVNG